MDNDYGNRHRISLSGALYSTSESQGFGREPRPIALFSKVQKIIAEDLPYVSLWFMDNVSVHRKRISNVQLSPTGDYDFLLGIGAR